MAHTHNNIASEHGSEHSNRLENQDYRLIDGPISNVSEDSNHATLHSKPLPPPDRFVRRGKVIIKPPAGPPDECVINSVATEDMGSVFPILDDPYDGILEALMESGMS
jgi:hypothetical protein